MMYFLVTITNSTVYIFYGSDYPVQVYPPHHGNRRLNAVQYFSQILAIAIPKLFIYPPPTATYIHIYIYKYMFVVVVITVIVVFLLLFEYIAPGTIYSKRSRKTTNTPYLCNSGNELTILFRTVYY